MSAENDMETVTLATELTVAWLSNPNSRVSVDDVPAFLNQMFSTVSALAGGTAPAAEPDVRSREPAVSVRKSLASSDHIISMIDGKQYKTLKRHLATNGMTPDEYREAFNLKPDYPMTAPAYSEARRSMAKKIGLGRKPGTKNKVKDDA